MKLDFHFLNICVKTSLKFQFDDDQFSLIWYLLFEYREYGRYYIM